MCNTAGHLHLHINHSKISKLNAYLCVFFQLIILNCEKKTKLNAIKRYVF